MSSRSLSFIIFTLLIAFAPVASATQLIVNGQEVVLKGGLIPSAEGVLAPLAELARYLGAEVSPTAGGFRLRWGEGQEAELRGGGAYIPITELTDLLGVRILKFDDSFYIFAPQAELLALAYSPATGSVRLRLSRLAPLEVKRKGRELELHFYNSILRIAPRTGRFPQGPLEQLDLCAKEPDQVILRLRLRRAADYRLSRSFIDGGYLAELELRQESSPVRWSSSSQASDGVRLTPWIGYHCEERQTAAGPVAIEYLLVRDYQDHYRLRVALPESGRLERLEELVRVLGGVAGINANFFDPRSNKPIGLVIRDGELLSPPYGRRAALGIDLFGRAVIFRQDLLPLLPLRDAVGAGPLLLEDGRVVVDHQGEGFTLDFVNKRTARSALGITPGGDLIMLVAREDGRSVGLAMEELAELLLELGAADALALDGGSSASLVFRRGLNLHSIGNRRIAVGLVLVPR